MLLLTTRNVLEEDFRFILRFNSVKSSFFFSLLLDNSIESVKGILLHLLTTISD